MLALFNRLVVCGVLVLSAALSAPAAAQTAYEFNLPPQSLADALRAIGRQTAMNILFEPQSVENKTAPAVRGRFSAEEAVNHVLTGTRLAAQQTAANTMLVRPIKRAAERPTTGAAPLSLSADMAAAEAGRTPRGWYRRLRLAQADAARSAVDSGGGSAQGEAQSEAE